MTPPAVLPSGRSVAALVVGGEEQVVVSSPDGAVEVRIVLTPAGPVVRVAAARLELAAGEVAVACRSLAVAAAGAVTVAADEFRVTTARSVHLNGETVRLNCADPPPGSGPAAEPGQV